jgi:hypothetical protein
VARTSKSPGSSAYFDALRKVFALQSEVLTAVLPHAGERGSNDEERCRAFLASVLPHRYGIGSGFVVSSTPGISRQQDVIIYDHFLNSPLYQELSAGVFPIEMVYATIEVKGRLQSRDINSSLASIGEVRRLSHQCWYEFPHRTDLPGRWALVGNDNPIKRPPRAFIFAYDTTYTSALNLKKALEHELNKPLGAHLHGIVVVSKDWFAFQRVPKTGESARVDMFEDNALLRFVNSMLDSLKSVIVREAAMGPYLNIPTAPAQTDSPPKRKHSKANKARP